MRANPPRNQQGTIVPHDHPDISDDHYVIRHTNPNDLCPDGAGGSRLASGAFSESSEGGMSVDIEDWAVADGLDSLHYVTDPTNGAVRIRVGELRKQGFQVGWHPDDAHPHHGLVWGIGNGSKRKRRVKAIAQTVRKVLGES